MEMPSFNDVFGSNVDSAEVDFDVSYFGISPEGQMLLNKPLNLRKEARRDQKISV
jgi:hypothetical protein